METATDNPFTAILGDGETILWMGQPNTASQLIAEKRQTRVVAIWFAVIFFVMALSAWILHDTVGWYFSVMFLVVACIQIFVAAVSNSRFKGYDWRYAVTDKRVLFYDPHSEGTDLVGRLRLDRIKRVTAQPKSGGIGNIRFETKFLALESGLAFHHVADVAEVQELVVLLMTGVRQGARK